jgi:chemotaxis protein CheC
MSSTLTPHSSVDVLAELFHSATNHASKAMAQWTHGHVELSLEEIQEHSLEEISCCIDMGAELMRMVVLGIQGDLDGQLILAFDEENSRKLAAALLQRDVETDSEWSPLETSALAETGNILASAYLSELTRLTEHKLLPSAPCLMQDFGASVLEHALMAQAMVSDRILVCRTRFQFNHQDVDWSVFFVPSRDLLHALGRKPCMECSQ